MRNVLSICFIAFLSFVCLSACVNQIVTQPKWYAEQIYNAQFPEFVGYGAGASKQAAETRALADLSLQIKSWIKVEQKLSTVNLNALSEQHFKEFVSLESNISVSSVKLIKQEQKQDHYFVAYRYSNLPVALKVAAKLTDPKCATRQHPYLSYTPLFLSIEKALGCMPEITLYHRQDQWMIEISGELFELNDTDLAQLFTRKKSNAIEMDYSSRTVSEGQYYHININHYKAGYLSLVQVFSDGQMQTLIDNKSIVANEKITYPDLKQYKGLRGQNLTNNPSSKDLTLAILCDLPIDLSRITEISSVVEVEKNQQEFTLLMNSISYCSVGADVLTVK